MNKLWIAATLGAALALAGCASNSGVVPIGPNLFTSSKQQATGFPGLGNLKSDLLTEANGYCAKQGRTMTLVHATETQPPYVLGNYPRVEIQFGCAAPSGVLPIGPDTYSITLFSNQLSARGPALKEAGDYCTQLGKKILVLNIDDKKVPVGTPGNTDIVFRCLSEGDPELKRPNLEARPDVVIQDRRLRPSASFGPPQTLRKTPSLRRARPD